MSKPRTVRYRLDITREKSAELRFLQNLYGISTIVEFFNLSCSVMKLIAEGILNGKKLALIDPDTEECEVISHDYFARIEKLRDESM